MINYLKASLLTTLIFVLGLFFYIFWSFDKDYALKNVYELLASNETMQAKKELLSLSSGLSTAEQHLYHAYRLRDEGKFDLAKETITLAYQSQGCEAIDNELQLNTFLDAYLSNNTSNMMSSYNQLSESKIKEAVLPFLKGVLAYQDQEYVNAKELLDPKLLYSSSAWLQRRFSHIFSSNWIYYHQAHCCFENQQFVQGRALLEQLKKEKDKTWSERCLYLVGLSYLLESADKALQVQVPYYQMALSYFTLIPLKQKGFQKENEFIGAKLFQLINQLIINDSYEEIPSFLMALNEMEMQSILNELAPAIYDTINAWIFCPQQSKLHDLNPMLQKAAKIDSLGQALSHLLESDLEVYIESNHYLPITRYWTIISALDLQELYRSRLIDLSQKYIKKSYLEDSHLDHLLDNLAFFDALERNASKRFNFAKELIDIAFTKSNDQTSYFIRLAGHLPFLEHKDEMMALIQNYSDES